MSPSQPLFPDGHTAITSVWRLVFRLTVLVAWLIIATAHLAAFCLVAVLLWWLQVGPDQTTGWVRGLLQSPTGALLGIAGLSAASLVAAYGWLLRRVYRRLIDAILAVLRPSAD